MATPYGIDLGNALSKGINVATGIMDVQDRVSARKTAGKMSELKQNYLNAGTKEEKDQVFGQMTALSSEEAKKFTEAFQTKSKGEREEIAFQNAEFGKNAHGILQLPPAERPKAYALFRASNPDFAKHLPEQYDPNALMMGLARAMDVEKAMQLAISQGNLDETTRNNAFNRSLNATKHQHAINQDNIKNTLDLAKFEESKQKTAFDQALDTDKFNETKNQNTVGNTLALAKQQKDNEKFELEKQKTQAQIKELEQKISKGNIFDLKGADEKTIDKFIMQYFDADQDPFGNFNLTDKKDAQKIAGIRNSAVQYLQSGVSKTLSDATTRALRDHNYPVDGNPQEFKSEKELNQDLINGVKTE